MMGTAKSNSQRNQQLHKFRRLPDPHLHSLIFILLNINQIWVDFLFFLIYKLKINKLFLTFRFSWESVFAHMHSSRPHQVSVWAPHPLFEKYLNIIFFHLLAHNHNPLPLSFLASLFQLGNISLAELSNWYRFEPKPENKSILFLCKFLLIWYTFYWHY